MTCKVKGILLRIKPTIHEERALTLLTDGMGCITVFAKAGKKANYDQFYYGEWVLYQTGGGNYLLNSFTLEEPFHPMRENIENTFLAGYFAQVVLYFGRSNEAETGQLLSLLLNSLYLLGRGKDPLLVKSVFELKTMQMMGYCPTLADCGHTVAHFSLEDGGVLCQSCAVSVKTVPVTPSGLAAIAFVLNKEPAKAFGFTLPQEELIRLNALTEAFLMYHLELNASALEMWKSIYELS